ncbi:hypothetical protein BDR04DRAFT_1122050 [Suillus decipiens]|nr:hypothetical protein BDR04DRAFT_1122050 [Suillus decipiens]
MDRKRPPIHSHRLGLQPLLISQSNDNQWTRKDYQYTPLDLDYNLWLWVSAFSTWNSALGTWHYNIQLWVSALDFGLWVSALSTWYLALQPSVSGFRSQHSALGTQNLMICVLSYNLRVPSPGIWHLALSGPEKWTCCTLVFEFWVSALETQLWVLALPGYNLQVQSP